MEQIRPIPNHKTYGATPDGRIWCLRTERELIPQITPEGYKRVYLTSKDGTKQYAVHRLVAFAFIPNPENKPEIDHIDRNPSNNIISNLRWSTDEEQMLNTKGKGAFPKFITFYEENTYSGWCIQLRNTTCKYKKRFNSKKYTLEQVLEERNKILSQYNIPIVD